MDWETYKRYKKHFVLCSVPCSWWENAKRKTSPNYKIVDIYLYCFHV